MSSSLKETEEWSWRKGVISGMRDGIHACLSLGVMLGTLGLFYLAGIPIKFNFDKNSPEVAYMIAGIFGGITMVRLTRRQKDKSGIVPERRRES